MASPVLVEAPLFSFAHVRRWAFLRVESPAGAPALRAPSTPSTAALDGASQTPLGVRSRKPAAVHPIDPSLLCRVAQTLAAVS